MSRDEAAKYLGVSAGAADRYAARGKLRARAGEPGGKPSYDEEELRRFKEEMGARVRAAGARPRRRRTPAPKEAVAERPGCRGSSC